MNAAGSRGGSIWRSIRAMPENTPHPDAKGRRLFETMLRELPREQRILMARTVVEAPLEALCFDPDPGVIAAVLENPTTGFVHARLVAMHHRNPVGLAALARKAA